jgi:hypothetical protein
MDYASLCIYDMHQSKSKKAETRISGFNVLILTNYFSSGNHENKLKQVSLA